MEINRNNYEEYFLLYADNELSNTEKKVVEIFLQENPDLKEEFLMIQLTVNAPEEEAKLIDKSFLIKKVPSFIDGNNYEEIFVLYFDNELSISQKKEVEIFVTENPKYKTEFELIGEAKLFPDNSIVYPDKKELLRKEKSGKVIPLILWRAMAAAVFIGFGLWITVAYFNKTEVHQSVATTINHVIEKPAIKETKPKSIVKENYRSKVESVASSIQDKELKKINKNESEKINRIATEEKIKKESIAKTETKVAPNEEKMNLEKQKNDFQLAANEPIKELPETIEKTANSFENNTAMKQKNEIDAPASKTNYARTASYISDADQKNDNYVFYDVSTEEFKKSKVGGFLKKVKRIVERTNPITRLLGDEEQTAAK
jgi:hypothetical protein